MELTDKRSDELVKTKDDLFDQFKNLTVAESKLMLLGLTDISSQIRDYGEFLKELRRKYYDGNTSLKESDMNAVRSKLLDKRKLLFSELAKAYKKGL
ncbi:hypothetical protein CWC16_17305 [Pseudoalteromonas sp. S3776]|uniref:hypothetical protein n=1 Tax=Pseudoalteromonas sp. S3776 TaxID=579544 RepID=UPI001107ADBA|nr:hypothetical protein [Pseudoalteromonas sp. S3776]TMO77188.1 hypothetical protein CWC16_17305 [Pseudoalteromonas sp. S3776]